MRIQRKDNWGHITYWLGDTQISRGDTITVEWPDAAEDYVVQATTEITQVSEQGVCVVSTVANDRLFIHVPCRGKLCRLDVEELESVRLKGRAQVTRSCRNGYSRPEAAPRRGRPRSSAT
jgi:hypothetical protein